MSTMQQIICAIALQPPHAEAEAKIAAANAALAVWSSARSQPG
jgi:hypothetical protein